jgi:tetratricopeptide (TPR) repeat protein
LLKKKLGSYDEAEIAELEALKIVQQLFGDSHYKRGVWMSHLGDIQRKKGMIQKALNTYTEARVVLRNSLEETHEEVSMVDMSSAMCLKKLARYDDALQLYQKVVRNLTAVFGDRQLRSN